jgi:hypothetical protein
VSALFYAGVTALLLGVLFQLWGDVLPSAISVRIGHNSEGYVLALAIAAWIQFARTPLRGTRWEWPITVLVATAFIGLTIYLLVGGLASRFKTLNEATLAAALLIPYVQLRRPLPRATALWVAVAIVVVTAVTNRTSTTTDLAETYGMIFLGVVGLDLIDRGILDPAATTRRALRWSWYALMVIAPVAFSIAEYHLDAGSTGIIGEPVRFMVRITEAFIFALFVQVFFAVGLGRTGRSTRAAEPAATSAQRDDRAEAASTASPPATTI